MGGWALPTFSQAERQPWETGRREGGIGEEEEEEEAKGIDSEEVCSSCRWWRASVMREEREEREEEEEGRWVAWVGGWERR